MSKKILITGATGLIGKEAIPFLLNKGYEVYAISAEALKSEAVKFIQCDLCDFDSLKKTVEMVKPECLLHFAWITGGDYLTNPQNIALKEASENLLRLFAENGGKRAVFAGTCFEYDIDGKILTEESRINPKTLYAQTKNELHEFCEKYSKDNNISFGWGRIFYVFGHGEKSSRLTAAIIDSLKNDKEFNIGAPENYLDYMYTKDIASAFVAFLESSYEGSVNICTGKGILLKDYGLKIQELIGKQNLIKFNNSKSPALKVVGDNTILRTVIGFNPKYTVESGLREVIKEI